MELLDKLNQVKTKLEKIRSQDVKLEGFGARAHKYRLNPPVLDEQLRYFEETHQITLPEDYRVFLAQVGNGSAGPYYGLMGLENCLDHVDNITNSLLISPFSIRSDGILI